MSSSGRGYWDDTDIAASLRAQDSPNKADTLVATNGDCSLPLEAKQGKAVAVDVYNHAIDGDIAATLNEASGVPNHSGPKVMSNMAVRRLTPLEAERLQGFPDGYTLIPRKNGKPAADGPRYRALGNSMAVNCMRWIGTRIQMLEESTPC